MPKSGIFESMSSDATGIMRLNALFGVVFGEFYCLLAVELLSVTTGAEKNTNGMASGPNTAPITPQKIAFAFLLLATRWQMIADAIKTSVYMKINIFIR